MILDIDTTLTRRVAVNLKSKSGFRWWKISVIKGKKVLNHYYWHESLLSQQPSHVQAHVAEAIDLARLEGMQTYNVVKYAEGGQKVSLLDYSQFFDNPFPSLWSSYTVDLIAKTVNCRSYDESRNPPILHRKELLLPADHFRISEYQSLT